MDRDARAPAPEPPRRRPPILALLGMLALAAPLVLLGLGRGAGPPTSSAPADGSDGRRGAIRAPGGPSLQVAGAGDLALPGVVVDASGMPVADVSVTAELEPGDRAPAPGTSDAAPAPAPTAVIATTGGDGRFALAGLTAGRHRLRVEGADIFTAEVRFVAVPADDVRIVVARRVAITGTVVDAGTPVAGATVEIAGDSIAGRRRAQTAADGTFGFDALPEGTFQVWAWQGDLAARTQRVPRLGAGPFAAVTLVVEPAVIVVGRVIERDGDGVAAAVELQPLDGDAEAPRYARTGADGVFRIEGVPHGRWTADAWSPGWVTAGTVEFEAGRGVPSVELIAGGVIEGRVVDDQGQGVAGASVRAVGVTRPDGAGLAVSADDELERLRRYSGMAPGRAPTDAGSSAATMTAATADPRFVPRGELGVLLGPIPFPPAPGARIDRRAAIIDDALYADAPDASDPAPLAADPAHAATWITDADGGFRITGLPRGQVTVLATAPGLAEGASDSIPTAPGRTTAGVAITLSPGAMLVGTITDQRGNPVIGATVAVRTAGRDDTDAARALETVTGIDGTYRIGPVTGTVTLRASAYAHGDATLEVQLPRAASGARTPVEERRDLVLVVADAVLTGTVEDPGGLPVRGATVAIAAGPAAGRSAITDEAGFRIEMLPPGTLVVRIDHPDYPLREIETTTEAIAHLVLPWGGGIDGLVLDHHTDAPVGGVVITATGPGGDRDETAVQASGAFELGPLVPGTWRLAIGHPGYLAIERTIEVPVGDRAGAITVHDVRLELERGALIAGTVRDRFGTRIAGVAVTARRASGEGPTVTARTDADGEFRLRDAPTGVVVLRAAGDRIAGSIEVTTAPGDERLAIEIELR